MPTIISEWIYCPVCGNKTRTMIREDTELKNFPQIRISISFSKPQHTKKNKHFVILLRIPG